MSDSNPPEFFSTVPISIPIVVPEAEDTQMNGFVWSHQFGLLLAFGSDADPIIDELQRLREPIETIRTNDQGLREV